MKRSPAPPEKNTATALLHLSLMRGGARVREHVPCSAYYPAGPVDQLVAYFLLLARYGRTWPSHCDARY